MKPLSIIADWLFSLCLPLLLLTATIGAVINSAWLYNYGFTKYNVGQTTGLAPSELDKAAHGLISYFNSGEEYINVTVIKDGQPMALFNEREIIHLKDVKGLIRLDYWLLLGTGVYCLGYALTCLLWRRPQYQRTLAKATLGGSGLTLGLSLLLGLGAAVDFGNFWPWLHMLGFSNDFWQLDPSKDYLIMLITEGFQNDAALIVFGVTLGLALVLGGVAGVYLWRTRRKVESEGIK